MAEWQPIATVPKDGTTVIVFFKRQSLGVQAVFWGLPEWDDREVTPDNGLWCIDDNKHGPYSLRGYSEGDATHWMPMPEPPQRNGPRGPAMKGVKRLRESLLTKSARRPTAGRQSSSRKPPSPPCVTVLQIPYPLRRKPLGARYRISYISVMEEPMVKYRNDDPPEDRESPYSWMDGPYGEEEHRQFHYSTDTEWDHADAIERGRANSERAWICTDRDVWHRNPFYIGPPVRHPEDDDDD